MPLFPDTNSDVANADIVVEIDDSPTVDRALATATQLTRRLGLALRLVSMHRRNGTGAEYSWRRTLLDDARRSLITRYPDLDGQIDARVLVDDASICPLCEVFPRPITVAATYRVADHAEHVVRLSAKRLACQTDHHSIVVVGPRVDDEWRAGPIAVALNGSPFFGSALSAAAGWAAELGVDLEVLDVLKSAKSALSHAKARQYLRAARRHVDDDGFRIRCHTEVNEDPACAVARFLGDHSCPLIAMAAPRARDTKRGAIDAVTRGIIAQSPCPVLLGLHN